MRGLAESDQPRHVAHRDRWLLDQQLGGHFQPALAQLLMKSGLAELGEGACELTRRAGKRPCDRIERERTSIVAGDDDTRLQIQATALFDRGGTHTPLSDRPSKRGHDRAQTGLALVPFAGEARQLAYSAATRSAAAR